MSVSSFDLILGFLEGGSLNLNPSLNSLTNNSLGTVATKLRTNSCRCVEQGYWLFNLKIP